MSEGRTKADWPIVAGLVLAVVVAALGLYVGGYFAMTASFEQGAIGYYRTFHFRWQAIIYSPAARVESRFRGQMVTVEDGPSDPYPVAPQIPPRI